MNVFFFEPHYVLAKSYAQEVQLNSFCVPTIDGFQCPTVLQDPEQNALLKALLFTPFACTDPMACGNVLNFRNTLSNGGEETLPRLSACASQPAASSSSSCAFQPVAASSTSCGDSLPSGRKYTFQRAWRLRRSEIHVLAARADHRSTAARKSLVLADVTSFAEMKEPAADIEVGKEVMEVLGSCFRRQLQRRPASQPLRLIIAFAGLSSRWHPEQCTLAEFSSHVIRDVIAHVDLAAEARVKKPRIIADDESSEKNSDSDACETRRRPAMEMADVGGGDIDAIDLDAGDVPPGERSNFPVANIAQALALCFQHDDLAALPSKTRKSQSDLDLKDMHDAYTPLLEHPNFGLQAATAAAAIVKLPSFGEHHSVMVALQKKTIALARKQLSEAKEDSEENAETDALPPSSAAQPAEATPVPLPLAMQGPAAVARQLLLDAS